MNEASLSFQSKKWTLVLGMLVMGMGMGLGLCLSTGLVMGKGYPESYILGPPTIRFNDFTDEVMVSVLPNPYIDPTSFYPPATYLFLRSFARWGIISWAFICFFSLGFTALLLDRLQRPIIAGSWPRVSLSFLFLAISYPFLFCVDRGNIEIILVPLIGWAVYCFSLRRDAQGAFCLFPAICLKLYPALFLVLLLRRAKYRLVVFCCVGVIAVTAGSCFFFGDSPGIIWNSYRQNLDFYRENNLLGNSTLEGSASIWNTYKILLVGLQKWNVLPIINFGFDGPLLRASYLVYTVVFGLLALICLAYAWFCESRIMRGVVVLCLFVSIAAPSGADYRLMYASLALVFLVVLPQRRTGDWTALILIALAVIPKKEFFFQFVGRTETGYADVSIQSLLNPVLILAAMGILLCQAGYRGEWARLQQKFRRFGVGWWPTGTEKRF